MHSCLNVQKIIFVLYNVIILYIYISVNAVTLLKALYQM